MSAYWNIPTQYQKGVYALSDFAENQENEEDGISIEYEDCGEIVICTVPDRECGGELILYEIPQDALEQTLRAVYGEDGCLEKIVATIEKKEKLLYIYYADAKEARREIENFAVRTADAMAEEIAGCREEVFRLFVEYFDDGDAMDYHAKIGTVAQKEELMEKYPNDPDIVDNCGDYPGKFIKGDNDGLAIRVKCAGGLQEKSDSDLDFALGDEEDFFRFAVDVMTKRIEEKIDGKLNLAKDFKFLCKEYD